MALLYHQTEGNALFLVNLLEHLVEQGMVKQEGAQWTLRSSLRAVPSLPEAPQLLITKRFERLDRDAQHVLEVASVAGDVFAAATVAAGLDVPVAQVEALCATLGQQHDFLEYAGLDEWPDGTVSGCYRFHHALYRQVLAERLGALQRMQVHRRMGERGAGLWLPDTDDRHVAGPHGARPGPPSDRGCAPGPLRRCVHGLYLRPTEGDRTPHGPIF